MDGDKLKTKKEPPKKIKVWARVRPTAELATDSLELLTAQNRINIHFKKIPHYGLIDNSINDYTFKLDGVLHNASQEHVFSAVAADVVTSALDGYSGTLICYGQTGAGKTFTMTGTTENYENRGLIPRGLSHLFQEIDKRSIEQCITVRISYLEIYKEMMFDLLADVHKYIHNATASPPALELTENPDGVYVKGLSCHVANNLEEAFNLLFEGESNRIVAAHSLNRVSSRSHCIFTVNLEIKARSFSSPLFTLSKLNFVDLAGSERSDLTKATVRLASEAMYLNRSLCLLEQVVITLAKTSREQVCFRHCKLTHYLKQSIGGPCNTVLIANIRGEPEHLGETMYTLRFATRVRSVSIVPLVTQLFEPDSCKFCRSSQEKVAQLKTLEKEVEHLKEELTLKKNATSGQAPFPVTTKYKINLQCRKYLDGVVEDIRIASFKDVPVVMSALRDIYNCAEAEMEEKMKRKFLILEKATGRGLSKSPMSGQTPPDLTSAVEEDLVGDTDGTGFGVGSAPKYLQAEPSLSAQQMKKQTELRRRSANRKPTGKKGEGRGFSKSDKKVSASAKRSSRPLSPQDDGQLDQDIEEMDNEASELTRPSTPPSRASTFDEFKQGRGCEVNRILLENKQILASKKKEYNDLARIINDLKKEIDNVRENLETLRETREAEGPTYTDDGDIVITEDEFMAIKQLKNLKVMYHTQFPKLTPLRARVQYCENLVKQCRRRLLLEFDRWYVENFQGEEITDEKSAVSTQDSPAFGPAAGNVAATTSVTGGTPKVSMTSGMKGSTTSFTQAGTTAGQQSGLVAIGEKPGMESKMLIPSIVEDDIDTKVISPLFPQIMKRVPEDQVDFFSRRRLELLDNNEDSAAFYNAKMRVQRRKTYKSAIKQPQLSYHKKHTKTRLEQSPLLSQRKPGRCSPNFKNEQTFLLKGF
ncbi:hypothetical protein BaRGS_00036122 [Batillaria attramentaria]|uniref:Kinesin-like protein n=1 Tax=Batillaria attramentaria TaxID=370345 RepID=A0ABD0JC94_9CAEN